MLRFVILVGGLLLVGVPLWFLAGGIGPGGTEEEAAPPLPMSRDRSPDAEDDPAARRRIDGKGADAGLETRAFGGKRANGPRLTVTVLGPAGSPLAGSFLVLNDGTRLLGSGTSDDDGRWSVDGEAARLAHEAHSVIVLAPARAAWEGPLRVEDDHAVVHVPAGARLEGRVTVAGARPDEPVTLRISDVHTTASSVDWRTALAHVVFTHRPQGRLAVRTDALDRFAFHGLDPEWSGRLEIGPPWCLAETAARSLELAAPRSDLHLRLQRLWTLSGRFVEAATGEPRPEVRWSLGVSSAAWSFTLSGRRADAQGRFRMHLDPVEGTRVTLHVPRREGEESTEERSHLHHLMQGDLDLGDIRLETPRTGRVRVLDGTGQPIAGALVAPVGRDLQSEPTDREGRTRLALDLGVRRLAAAGPNHARREVELPPDLESEITIRLDRAAVLELAVEDPEGTPVGGAQLRIRAPAPKTPGSYGFLGDLRRALDRQGFSWSVGPEDLVATPWRYASDSLRIVDVPPEVPLQIEVSDISGEVALRRVLRLKAGEKRSLVLRVDSGPRVVRGRVEDEAGRPLADAVVRFPRPGAGRMEVDAKGRFRAEPLLAPSVRVAVEAEGHAVRVLDLRPLAETAAATEIVLASERIVVVEVVEEDGAPVADVPVTARQGGRSLRIGGGGFRAPTDARGRVRVSGLAEGPARFTAHLGAREQVALVHDTARPEARLVVPQLGTLEVLWPAIEEPEDTEGAPAFMLRLLRIAEEGSVAPVRMGVNHALVFSREPLSIPHLVAGRYRVALEEVEGREFRVVTEAAEAVEVHGGKTTRVVLP